MVSRRRGGQEKPSLTGRRSRKRGKGVRDDGVDVFVVIVVIVGLNGGRDGDLVIAHATSNTNKGEEGQKK